jgi:hypothetical protein
MTVKLENAELTAAQKQLLQRTGQRVIDLLGRTLLTKAETNDLRFILMVLCSVLAHYLAGLRDDEVLKHVYDQFGGQLMRITKLNQAAGSAAEVEIVDAGKLQ